MTIVMKYCTLTHYLLHITLLPTACDPACVTTLYAACVPVCVRGTCTEDRVCECPEGWTGEDCNTPGMNIKVNTDCHYYNHDSHSDRPSAYEAATSGTYVISTH